MRIQRIFDNNEKWIAEKLDMNKEYFHELAEGQTPEILYIGCSDSRVTAEELMGAAPGEIFVHRNISNMVSNLDLSSASVINYAVERLKVKHVVICGHYYCGGVKAAMGSENLGILNPWLRNIRDVYRLNMDELDAIQDEEERYKRLVEFNVEAQCLNTLKKAEVQIGYREWGLRVHGWVFDIHSGKIIDLKVKDKEILEKIKKVYHIDV